MTFFTEAKEYGHIDEKIDMNQQEFEMMLRGMLEDSNAWHLHKNKHKDAHIVPIFEEDLSEFEERVQKHSNKIEEPSIMQYDKNKEIFTGGCDCGAKFDIDIKKDKVEEADPNLKMKELPQYNRNSNENNNNTYGNNNGNNDNSGYNNRPIRIPNVNYNSHSQEGMKYKS